MSGPKVRMTPQRLSWRHGAHNGAKALQAELVEVIDKAAAAIRALEQYQPDDRAPDFDELHAGMHHALVALRKFEASAAGAAALYRQFSADAALVAALDDDGEGGE